MVHANQQRLIECWRLAFLASFHHETCQAISSKQPCWAHLSTLSIMFWLSEIVWSFWDAVFGDQNWCIGEFGFPQVNIARWVAWKLGFCEGLDTSARVIEHRTKSQLSPLAGFTKRTTRMSFDNKTAMYANLLGVASIGWTLVSNFVATKLVWQPMQPIHSTIRA